MRRVDELRTVTISTAAGRTVEGQVRVRGIDARAGGRGFRLERREPVSVLIRENGSLRRVALPRPERRALAIWIAAPVAALIARRIVARRRS
jgi:hypothetical protein